MHTRTREAFGVFPTTSVGSPDAWANAVEYGYETFAAARDWLAANVGQRTAKRFVALVRAAWPAECQEQYEIARGYAGVASRLWHEHGDLAARDAARLRLFDAVYAPADWQVPCPI